MRYTEYGTGPLSWESSRKALDVVAAQDAEENARAGTIWGGLRKIVSLFRKSENYNNTHKKVSQRPGFLQGFGEAQTVSEQYQQLQSSIGQASGLVAIGQKDLVMDWPHPELKGMTASQVVIIAPHLLSKL